MNESLLGFANVVIADLEPSHSLTLTVWVHRNRQLHVPCTMSKPLA